jgi:saccharopine dehydrogenase-like NADP-dependent oxidoreductase
MIAQRVVLVGGAGVFGSRLARGMVATSNAEVVIAGRDLARAQAAAKTLGATVGVALDRSKASGSDIAALKPDLVIDAAGPFQGADLSFARACIAAGVDYLDLADARDFVAAFPSLDAEARAANVRAIAGASSTPALTHAALEALTAGWRRINIVRAGISAGSRAPGGKSLIAAILNWAGAPVRVFEGGRWITRAGWRQTVRRALPDLGHRRFALAETADLDLIPARFAPREEAVFLAGLELGPQHHGLGFLAGLRQAGIIRDLQPFAGMARALAPVFAPFGSDRGGMFVEVFGRDADDRPARAEWTIVAPPAEGPFTPTLPALALARKLLSGESIAPGARPCVGLLSLEDLASDFARHGLVTHVVVEQIAGPFEERTG